MKKYLFIITLLLAFTAVSTSVIMSKAETLSNNTESAAGSVYSIEKNPLIKTQAIGQSNKKKNIKEPVQKIAYLTFDDGPNPNVTPKILKTLKEYNVKATFFMLGASVKEYPSVAKMVYSEGHYIGNHTLTHSWGLFKSLSRFKSEVLTTNKIIEETIGYKPTLFRSPYGKKLTKACREFLKSEGIKIYYWNVDSKDSRRPNIPAKTIYKSTIDSLNGRKEIMILMHDGGGHKQTAYALPLIIQDLKKKGYEIRPLTPDTVASPKLDWNN